MRPGPGNQVVQELFGEGRGMPRKIVLFVLFSVGAFAAAPAIAQEVHVSSQDEISVRDVALPDDKSEKISKSQAAKAFDIPEFVKSLTVKYTGAQYTASIKQFLYKPLMVNGISDFFIARSDLAAKLPKGIYGDLNYGPRVSNETLSVLRGSKYEISYMCKGNPTRQLVPISNDTTAQTVILQCN